MGSGDGSGVGSVVGSGVGSDVGRGEGSAVGVGIGTGVGAGIGTGIGTDVGAGIGTGVGAWIGTGVGAGIGTGVEPGVALSICAARSTKTNRRLIEAVSDTRHGVRRPAIPTIGPVTSFVRRSGHPHRNFHACPNEPRVTDVMRPGSEATFTNTYGIQLLTVSSDIP